MLPVHHWINYTFALCLSGWTRLAFCQEVWKTTSGRWETLVPAVPAVRCTLTALEVETPLTWWTWMIQMSWRFGTWCSSSSTGKGLAFRHWLCRQGVHKQSDSLVLHLWIVLSMEKSRGPHVWSPEWWQNHTIRLSVNYGNLESKVSLVNVIFDHRANRKTEEALCL